VRARGTGSARAVDDDTRAPYDGLDARSLALAGAVRDQGGSGYLQPRQDATAGESVTGASRARGLAGASPPARVRTRSAWRSRSPGSP